MISAVHTFINTLRFNKGGLKRWGRRTGWALADQVLFALSNFTMSVALARWLPPEEYGVFTVAYTIFLLVSTFHTALLTEPMMVFGSGRYRERLQAYTPGLIKMHFLFSLPITTALAIVAAVFFAFDQSDLGYSMLALTVGSPFIFLLWLVRRICYIRLAQYLSAAGGCAYLLIMLGAACIAYRFNVISPTSAFLIMTASSLVVAAAMMLWLEAQSTEGFWWTKDRLTESVADHWRYGRWGVATGLLSWAPLNIQYLLLPLSGGLEESATLRALMNIIMPWLQVKTAVGVVLVMAFGRTHRDAAIMRQRFTILVILMILASLVYGGFIGLFREPIFALLYGGQYDDEVVAVWLTAALVVPSGMSTVLGSALRARERPDLVFWANLTSAIFAVVFGIVAAMIGNLTGAIIVTLTSLTINAGLMLWLFLRAVPAEYNRI